MSPQDDDRVRDLLRRGDLPAFPVRAEAFHDDLVGDRGTRRPVGNSPRLWRRVTGDDPFDLPAGRPVTRRTVYADGRFVRIDRDRKEAQRARSAPSGGHRPAPAPRAPAAKTDGNLGEALIPEGFRNLPTAAPKPKAPPKPPPRPEAPATPARPPEPAVSPSGRFRTGSRRRQVLSGATPVRRPLPEPAPPDPRARTPAPSTKAETVEVPVRASAVETPAPPAADAGSGDLDDLFSSPLKGRARTGRRRLPRPAGGGDGE